MFVTYNIITLEKTSTTQAQTSKKQAQEQLQEGSAKDKLL